MLFNVHFHVIQPLGCEMNFLNKPNMNIVLRKKSDGFLLFLKAFSLETDLWVTLGDFTEKTEKLGICIQMKID